MKTTSRLRYFLYLSILIVGCTTGKNALQKGNFDASVKKSVERLKNSPKNAEALQVLGSAYELSLKNHLRKIEEAKLSAAMFRWEEVLNNYEELNVLAEEIKSCTACLAVVPNAQQFNTEIAETKYKAATVRYELGVNLLNENTRSSARKAYDNFGRAQQLQPNYKDVKEKRDEAYWAAVVRVVVQPVQIKNSYYNLSNLYFQQQVNSFIRNYSRNKFVLFYDEKQAAKEKIVPDQVLSLNFDDFVIGQTYVKENVEKMKRDSVIIGKTRVNKPIYATVKANFSIFSKKVSSSGLLSLIITDWNTQRIIKQQQIAGTYVWHDSWASYKGDERALTNQQLKLVGKREVLPPSPEILFVEFTKPIYAQLVDEVNYFYNQY